MSTGSVGSTGSTAAAVNKSDPFASMSTGDFLKLMITELQNQDPTSPEDTSQIMQEIGQMQSIESTTQLTTTLNAMSLGQGLTSASLLINQNIVGLDSNGNSVNGTVSSVL